MKDYLQRPRKDWVAPSFKMELKKNKVIDCFKENNPVINKKTLVISVCQSGETADTLGAMEIAKAKPLIFLTAFQKASQIEIKKNPAKKASRPSQKPWGVLAYASNLCSGVTNSAASKINGMVIRYSVAGNFNTRLNSLSKMLSGFFFR